LDCTVTAVAQIITGFLMTPEREPAQALKQCRKTVYRLTALDEASNASLHACRNKLLEGLQVEGRMSPTGVCRIPLRGLIQNEDENWARLRSSSQRGVIFQSKIPLEPNHLNLRMLTFGHEYQRPCLFRSRRKNPRF
jgi:hypothetical protein